ncbi:MAG: hypothetical protein ABH810_00675 [bacterium]
MKIINDPNMISYRVALQQQMYKANSDLCVLMQDLRNKVQKKIKIDEQNLRSLKNQLTLVSSMFFELEFGNYFLSQNKQFQEKVINNLTKKYFDYVFDLSIENVGSFTMMQVYTDMEDELNKQIKAEQNGS